MTAMIDHADATRAPRAGVLERVTLILDALGEAPGRLLLEEVTQVTGLPRSTTFRMLRKLVDLGWVEHTTHGYSAGPRLTQHAPSSDQDEIRAAACSQLNELASTTGGVAHLGVLRSGFVQYVDKIGAGATPSVPSQIGARIPATEAAVGLAILAAMTPEDVDRTLADARLTVDRTPLHLHRELADIRNHHGVAHWNGRNRPGAISSIAAPVCGPYGPVAALSIARRGTLRMNEIAPLVLHAARATSRELYPDWDPGTRQRG
jgi:DNA-binding IclR family transcriptional regulator